MNNDNNTWLSIAEIAEADGISVEAARQRAARGHYEKTRVGNRTFYRHKTATPESVPGGDKAIGDFARYQKARAAKMESDAVAARVKAEKMTAGLAEEYLETIKNDFVPAFLPLRNMLASLGLNKAQTKKLAACISRCCDDFANRRRIRYGIKNEGSEDDTDD